jgi:hypothetical protein
MESMNDKWKRILLKSLYVQSVFIVLHYSYDWFPNTLTRIFTGTSEAVFQAMKMGFYSYGLVSLTEYFLNRVKTDQPSYGFARLTSTVFYPWPMFILFFAPAAYYGQYGTDTAEIVSANIILFLTNVAAVIFETEFEKIELSVEYKVVIVILGLVFLSLLVIFSFRYPWFDVFAIPPGWE